MTYELLAFAGFGFACLLLFAGAKSLDDRDRDHEVASRAESSSRAREFTTAFPIVDDRGRSISRPPDRISRPPDRSSRPPE